MRLQGMYVTAHRCSHYTLQIRGSFFGHAEGLRVATKRHVQLLQPGRQACPLACTCARWLRRHAKPGTRGKPDQPKNNSAMCGLCEWHHALESPQAHQARPNAALSCVALGSSTEKFANRLLRQQRQQACKPVSAQAAPKNSGFSCHCTSSYDGEHHRRPIPSHQQQRRLSNSGGLALPNIVRCPGNSNLIARIDIHIYRNFWLLLNIKGTDESEGTLYEKSWNGFRRVRAWGSSTHNTHAYQEGPLQRTAKPQTGCLSPEVSQICRRACARWDS